MPGKIELCPSCDKKIQLALKKGEAEEEFEYEVETPQEVVMEGSSDPSTGNDVQDTLMDAVLITTRLTLLLSEADHDEMKWAKGRITFLKNLMKSLPTAIPPKKVFGFGPGGIAKTKKALKALRWKAPKL